MRTATVLLFPFFASLSGCTSSGVSSDSTAFDVGEIRAAERAVVEALESSDPTAWVYRYTEDAVLLESGSEPIQGRAALLEMARTMKPLSSVVIAPRRTEGQGNLAYVYGSASWVNGRPPDLGRTTEVYLVIVWRKESDGQWRVAQEVFAPLAKE